MRRIGDGMDRKMAVPAPLKTRGHARLSEVAASLGLTRQGALRHLEALRERGLVEVSVAPSLGRGRPGHLYALTAQAGEAFPSGHRQLATELVDFMESTELERFFAARAQRLEEEYSPRLAGLSFEARVPELAPLSPGGGRVAEGVRGWGRTPPAPSLQLPDPGRSRPLRAALPARAEALRAPAGRRAVTLHLGR